MVERIGLRLIEPPGWVTVPIDAETTKPVRDVARRIAAASVPAVRAQVEQMVFDQLAEVRSEARENGGQDLLLPLGLVEGRVLPMSIVIAASPPVLAGSEKSQSDALLAHAARFPGAQAREVNGVLAVRTFDDQFAVPGTTDAAVVFSTRRVSWLVAAPIPSRQMLIVSCSIQRFDYDADGEILKAMEFLFDSIVGTIHFDRVEASA